MEIHVLHHSGSAAGIGSTRVGSALLFASNNLCTTQGRCDSCKGAIDGKNGAAFTSDEAHLHRQLRSSLSALPLLSSQFRSDRTLPWASAIQESAAP